MFPTTQRSLSDDSTLATLFLRKMLAGEDGGNLTAEKAEEAERRTEKIDESESVSDSPSFFSA